MVPKIDRFCNEKVATAGRHSGTGRYRGSEIVIRFAHCTAQVNHARDDDGLSADAHDAYRAGGEIVSGSADPVAAAGSLRGAHRLPSVLPEGAEARDGADPAGHAAGRPRGFDD